MSAPKINEQEKQVLRNNAKIELERLEACLADQRTVQLLDEFKNKFNIQSTRAIGRLTHNQRSAASTAPVILSPI